MFDVFISYSRKDYVDKNKCPLPGNIIDKLLDLFENAGIKPWIDQKGIYCGDAFAKDISRAIADSNIFLFISSCHSNAPECWSADEVALARKKRKHIIPLLLDNTPYNDDFSLCLAKFDYLDYATEGDAVLTKLVDSIHKKLDDLEPNRKIIRQLKEQQMVLRDVIEQKEQKRKRIIEQLANLGVEEEYESVCDSGRLVELRKEIEAKRAELEAKNAELSEKNKRIGELMSSLDSLEKDLSAAKAELSEKNHRIEELNARLHSLEKELSESRAANDAAKKAIEDLRKIKEKLEAANRQLQEDAEKYRLIRSNTLWFDGKEYALRYKNFSYPLIEVEGGTFTMGATREQGDDAYDDEKPAHKVTLSTYRMGRTAVPQWLWVAVMGNNPSNRKGDNLPVETVSWDDCQDFINKLNHITGQRFSLPTEAQWEFAARGGNKSKGYKYSGSNDCDSVAWYYGNSDGKTHGVATRQANELGLHDMSGNVMEWCSDWKGSYCRGSVTDPIGPSSGSFRVLRGGGWFIYARDCRVAYRSWSTPGFRISNLGLRLALQFKK